jgi:hypothetical protein
MMEGARYSATAKASPESIWHFYEHVELWKEWDGAMAWSLLRGPFVAGSSGVMKPKLGPKVAFTLVSVAPAAEFTLTSKLPGCTVYMHHDLDQISEDETRLTHRLRLDGPLQALWSRMFGRKLLRGAVETIIRLAEANERVQAS